MLVANVALQVVQQPKITSQLRCLRCPENADRVLQVAYDAALWYMFGWWAVIYLWVSTVMCGSFHPTAGHFLSEHLEVVEGIETYSYYGPLNYVCYNVGYHNEHHDFPFVPWSR